VNTEEEAQIEQEVRDQMADWTEQLIAKGAVPSLVVGCRHDGRGITILGIDGIEMIELAAIMRESANRIELGNGETRIEIRDVAQDRNPNESTVQ
jgi:hypothetical protein